MNYTELFRSYIRRVIIEELKQSSGTGDVDTFLKNVNVRLLAEIKAVAQDEFNRILEDIARLKSLAASADQEGINVGHELAGGLEEPSY